MEHLGEIIMKKTIIAISVFIAMSGMAARAQEINNMVLLEDNFRNSLWFNTNNSAALNFHPLTMYSNLGATYNGKYGGWHHQQEAATSNQVSVETDGAARVGKFLFWGDFAFRNIFDGRVNYNAMTYDVPEDMPYFVADKTPGRWNRQEYDMRTKISTPVIWDHLTFGAEVSYLSRVGAKQKDPRVETYSYDVRVLPSVFVQVSDDFCVGLSGQYENAFERGEPSNVNYRQDQPVWLSRGLGYAQETTVGGNAGLKTMYYETDLYGGALQAGYDGDYKLVTELEYNFRKIKAKQQPSLPRAMGNTESDMLKWHLQILLGSTLADKIDLTWNYRETAGLEVVQILNQELNNQRWEEVVTNHMSNFKRLSWDASYDHQFGKDEKGFDWDAGAKIRYDYENDVYFLPFTRWNWSSLLSEIFIAKQIKLHNGSWLLKADLGYGANIDARYEGFDASEGSNIQELYRGDMTCMSDDYLKAGARIAYTLNRKKVNYKFDLSALYFNTVGDSNYDDASILVGDKRLLTAFTFGIIF